eukprot:PhM_4_TR14402/c0_g1_i1/m.263
MFLSSRTVMWQNLVLMCDGSNVVAYDTASEAGHVEEPKYIVRVPSGTVLALWAHAQNTPSETAVAVTSQGHVVSFRLADGTVTRTVAPPQSDVEITFAASWCHDGNTIGMLTKERGVVAFNLATSAWRQVWTAPTEIVCLLPDGEVVAVADGERTDLIVYSDSKRKTRTIHLPVARQVTALIAHASVPMVGVAVADGTVGIVSVHSAKDAVFTKRWHSKAFAAMAWDPHDATTLLTGGDEAVLVSWSTVTYKNTTSAHLPGGIRSIVYSCTDATRVALVLDSARCVVMDMTANRPCREAVGLCWLGDGVGFTRMTLGHYRGRPSLGLYAGNTDEVRFVSVMTGRTEGSVKASDSNRVSSMDEGGLTATNTASNATLFRHAGVDHLVAYTVSNVKLVAGAALQSLRFLHYDSRKKEFMTNTVIHNPHTAEAANGIAIVAHPADGIVVTCGPQETKLWSVQCDTATETFWGCIGVRFVGSIDAVFANDGSALMCLHESAEGTYSIVVYDVASLRHGGTWSPLASMTLPSSGSRPRNLHVGGDDRAVVCCDDTHVYLWDLLSDSTEPTTFTAPSKIRAVRAVPQLNDRDAHALVLLETNEFLLLNVARRSVVSVTSAGTSDVVDFTFYGDGVRILLADATTCVSSWTCDALKGLLRETVESSDEGTVGNNADDDEDVVASSSRLTPLLAMPSGAPLPKSTGAEGPRVSIADLLAAPSHELPPMTTVLRSFLMTMS